MLIWLAIFQHAWIELKRYSQREINLKSAPQLCWSAQRGTSHDIPEVTSILRPHDSYIYSSSSEHFRSSNAVMLLFSADMSGVHLKIAQRQTGIKILTRITDNL